MYIGLGDVELKDGSRVRAGLVQGPALDWAEHIEQLLAHKGEPWVWQVRKMLRGDPVFESRFYILHRDGAPFANIMTGERCGVGLLGHVWTKPEDRKLGGASALLKRVLDDFRGRAGRALFLGTAAGSPAYGVYARQGFAPVEAGSGEMAYYVGSEASFERWYFGSGPTAIEPLSWRHWPSTPALFLGDYPGIVRCMPLQRIGRSLTEGVLIPRVRMEEERARRGEPPGAQVLVISGTSAVAGLACWGWDPLWPGSCLVDIYCHPSFWDQADSLLDALVLPKADRYLAHGDVTNLRKEACLSRRGFVPRARHANRAAADRAGTRFVEVIEYEGMRMPAPDGKG